MTDTIFLDGSGIVAGRITPPANASFTGVDPATGSTLKPSYAEASASEIDMSCRAAADAFNAEGGQIAAASALLVRWAGLLDAHGDQIVERADKETGLGIPRLQGELVRTTTQLRFLTGRSDAADTLDAVIDSANPSSTPRQPGLRRVNRPLGPVAVFGASNFPLAFSTAGGDTASALAAGCPVVIKAHPAHPGTSEIVGRLAVQALAEADLHPGWFSMLHGTEHRVGTVLVQHPDIKAVAFTGSLAGGRALFDIATRRPVPIPVFAEMGSLNPTFVFPDALTHTTATTLVDSFLLGVGQFCTKPGVIVVPDDALGHEFNDLVGLEVAKRTSGVMLTTRMAESVSRLVQVSVEAGAVKFACQDSGDAAASGPGVVLQTTLNHFLRSRALSEEHFGPVALVVSAPVDQFERVFEVIEGSLTATVFAGDLAQMHLAELLGSSANHAGRVLVNQAPTGVRVSPAMTHGGPYPSTTASATTSVGSAAIKRFLRPVSYQNVPDVLLPEALRDDNPLGIMRLVDGEPGKSAVDNGTAGN